MTHIVLLNLVFFIPATCGATASGLVIYRVLRAISPPEPPTRNAGPDDLALSA